MVDSNVLIDVITGDSTWADWSVAALADAGDAHRLVINAIVYAEVSASFERIEDVEAALPRNLLEREAIP